jgi:hypothetical protein
MKLRVVGHGGESRFAFGSSGPWCEFRDELLSKGHEVSSEPYGTNCDALIAHKHSSEALKEADDNCVPKNRRVLVLWEPAIVEKERYQREVLENYGTVFAPSVKWAQKVGANDFKWPQDKVQEIEKFNTWRLRKEKTVIIQGNKFSARKGELYTLRRKVIKKFENDIHLYGTNWNRGFAFDWLHWSMSAINSSIAEISFGSLWGIGKNYSNYFGSINSKSNILQQYKTAIVIENSADFVSEKLFDCVSAGCLVIYIGPNLSEFDLNIPNLIQVDANMWEIREKFNEVMMLPETELYKLAESHNRSLREVSHDWENTRVLRKLASDILSAIT